MERTSLAAIKIGVVIPTKVCRSNSALRWRLGASKSLYVAPKLGSEVSDLIGGHLMGVKQNASGASLPPISHMETLTKFVDLGNSWYWDVGSASDIFHGIELISEAAKLENPTVK